jgi:hypothetical protein
MLSSFARCFSTRTLATFDAHHEVSLLGYRGSLESATGAQKTAGTEDWKRLRATDPSAAALAPVDDQHCEARLLLIVFALVAQRLRLLELRDGRVSRRRAPAPPAVGDKPADRLLRTAAVGGC